MRLPWQVSGLVFPLTCSAHAAMIDRETQGKLLSPFLGLSFLIGKHRSGEGWGELFSIPTIFHGSKKLQKRLTMQKGLTG